MKVVKKNVYYCDFCKKKGLRSLKTHEKHCTGNPDRVCRLCDGASIKPIIEKYKKYFTIKETERVEVNEGFVWTTETFIDIKVVYHKEFTLKDIVKELEYECPNCILAIIRCLGLNRYYFEKKFKFNYKEELGEWWSEKNREDEEEDYRNLCY